MGLPPTLMESPSGIVHYAHVLRSGRIITHCGVETNLGTWNRISMLDKQIWGKGASTVRAMAKQEIGLDTCSRCFT